MEENKEGTHIGTQINVYGNMSYYDHCNVNATGETNVQNEDNDSSEDISEISPISIEDDETLQEDELTKELFNDALEVREVLYAMKELYYKVGYRNPCVEGAQRWYVLMKFFMENRIISKKRGIQLKFVQMIEKRFGWEWSSKDFAHIISPYPRNHCIQEWPKNGKYGFFAAIVTSTFIEIDERGKRQIKSKFLKTGRWIDINLAAVVL